MKYSRLLSKSGTKGVVVEPVRDVGGHVERAGFVSLTVAGGEDEPAVG